MSEFVRVVDRVQDDEELVLTIGVDHDMLTLASGPVSLRFDLEAAEEIGRALVSAAWEAGRNLALMSEEASHV